MHSVQGQACEVRRAKTALVCLKLQPNLTRATSDRFPSLHVHSLQGYARLRCGIDDRRALHKAPTTSNVVVGLTNRYCQYSTNCLQTGSECIYPTPEQPLPSNESSPSPSSSSSNVVLGSFGSQMARSEAPAPGMSNALNNYVGGSFDALPEPSKRLLRHCRSSNTNESRHD